MKRTGKTKGQSPKGVSGLASKLDTGVRNEEALLAKRLEFLQQLNTDGTYLIELAHAEPYVKQAESVAATLRELRNHAEEHDKQTSSHATIV